MLYTLGWYFQIAIVCHINYITAIYNFYMNRFCLCDKCCQLEPRDTSKGRKKETQILYSTGIKASWLSSSHTFITHYMLTWSWNERRMMTTTQIISSFIFILIMEEISYYIVSSNIVKVYLCILIPKE